MGREAKGSAGKGTKGREELVVKEGRQVLCGEGKGSHQGRKGR